MRAETFLSMYRVLEGLLGEKYAAQDKKTSSVVMTYIQDAESEPIRRQLDLCREVRNLLTHNADDSGNPVVEPSQALLDALYEIIKYVETPRSALLYATKAERILRAHPNDRALDIMRRMDKHGFSHVPVIDDGRITGVFSKSAIFSYILGGSSIGPDTRIRQLGEFMDIHRNRGGRYMIIGKQATYLDARNEFERENGRNSRLAVIFITDTGDETGMLLGMLTPWDVMRDVPDNPY